MGIGLDVAVGIVIRRSLQRCVQVLAEVDTQDALVLGGLEAFYEEVDTQVVEPQAIDDAARIGEPEHARLGVARLRARGHAAQFKKAESEGTIAHDAFAILVSAGCHADGVGELDAHHGAWIRRNGGCDQSRGAGGGHRVQAFHGEGVGVFRFEPEHGSTRNGIQQVQRHGRIPCWIKSTWRRRAARSVRGHPAPCRRRCRLPATPFAAPAESRRQSCARSAGGRDHRSPGY